MRKVRIHTLEYSEQSYFGGQRHVHFDLDHGVVRYYQSHYIEPVDPEHDFTTGRFDSDQLQQGLSKFNLPKWQREYQIYAHVDDGTSWDLLIRYNGNLKRRSGAYHCWPDSKGGVSLHPTPYFDAFTRLLDEMIGEAVFFR